MKLTIQDNNHVEIRGSISRSSQLQQSVPVDTKSLTVLNQKFISADLIRGLASCKELRNLHLNCEVARTAIKQVLALNCVEELSIFSVRSPGKKLCGFEGAERLKVFRCEFDLSSSDFIAISKSCTVKELVANNTKIDIHSVEALLRMPNLKSLNLEATDLDDGLVSILADSTRLTSLEIGATKITTRGLEKISEMKQLESLDIWATNISNGDLEMLLKLNNLKYLSIGNYMDQNIITSSVALPIIEKLRSLEQLFLDGVVITDSERKYLAAKYDYFVSI